MSRAQDTHHHPPCQALSAQNAEAPTCAEAGRGRELSPGLCVLWIEASLRVEAGTSRPGHIFLPWGVRAFFVLSPRSSYARQPHATRDTPCNKRRRSARQRGGRLPDSLSEITGSLDSTPLLRKPQNAEAPTSSEAGRTPGTLTEAMRCTNSPRFAGSVSPDVLLPLL